MADRVLYLDRGAVRGASAPEDVDSWLGLADG
jgi:hypothetical protein